MTDEKTLTITDCVVVSTATISYKTDQHGNIEVWMDDGFDIARDALIRMGWTPPESDDE